MFHVTWSPSRIRAGFGKFGACGQWGIRGGYSPERIANPRKSINYEKRVTIFRPQSALIMVTSFS